MDPYEPKFVTNLRKNLLLILLGVTVLIILLTCVGYQEVFKTISQINPLFIFLVFCIRPISLFLFSYKSYFLSKRIPDLKKISFWKYVVIQLSGMLVNNLTPGPSVGGEPLKAYYLEKATGLRGSACFGLFAMDSLVFLFTTFVFMAFSTFYLIFSIGIPKLRYFLAIWFLIFLIAAISMVFFIFKISKQKKRFEKFLRWLYNFPLLKIFRKNFKTADIFVRAVHSKQKAFMSMLKHLWKDKKAVWTIFMAGFVWYLLQGLALWLLFKGLGFSVPFFRLVAVITISLSVGYLVFVPGGTGVTEGSAVLIMSLLGVPASAITAVILVDRFTYYLMTYVFGYFAISYLSLIYTTPGKIISTLGK